MAQQRRAPAPPISGKYCEDHMPDYKDVEHLKKFLSAHGQILSRKRSGYCTQCQKALKLAIKRARHMALLPFVG
ncbi:MAG: ribosomal protein [Planctomycetota bacterium]|jgi:small subunit ribosomal protein S18